MLDIKKGTCAFSLLSKEEQKNVYAFLFNGHLHDVGYCMMEDGKLQTIDSESDTGKKIYDRTLSMLFISAVKQLYPDCEVHVEHSLSNGYFCRMEGKEHLDEKCVQMIQKRMQEMVEHKCIIHKVSMPLQKAVTFFKETNKFLFFHAYFLSLIASIGFLREIWKTGSADAMSATTRAIPKSSSTCMIPKFKIVTRIPNCFRI